MVTIDKTTIFSNPFKIVRDILIDNLTDPKSRFKTSIVHSSRQFPSDANFCGYPYVVVYPTSISEYNPSNDRKTKDFEFTIMIEIISDTTDGLDTVCDDINNILNTNDLSSNGLNNVTITSNEGMRDFIEGKEVFIRTLTLTGYNKIEVN